jgi:nucleoid DNA-binding protein
LETSLNKKDVMAIVESLMEETKDSVEKGEPVYERFRKFYPEAQN